MKKMFRVLLLLVLVLALSCSSVMAASRTKELEKLCSMVEKANAKIEKWIDHAKKTAKNDIDWLLEKVDKEVNPVKAYAEKLGVTVACEMDTHWIDGQWVEVDPLKVINLSDLEPEDEE